MRCRFIFERRYQGLECSASRLWYHADLFFDWRAPWWRQWGVTRLFYGGEHWLLRLGPLGLYFLY